MEGYLDDPLLCSSLCLPDYYFLVALDGLFNNFVILSLKAILSPFSTELSTIELFPIIFEDFRTE
jgi:hypothetical protein